MEDPSKDRREGPSERDRAIRRVEERDRALRKQLIRGAFRRRRGQAAAEGITLADGPAGWPRPPLAVARPRRPTESAPVVPATADALDAEEAPQKDAEAAPTGAAAKATKALREFAPVVFVLALWHRLLGEEHRKGEGGRNVVVPPAETDWRWHLHRFFRSNVRGMVYTRNLLLTCLVLSSAWVSLYATTGYDYTELVFPTGDPSDPRNDYRMPFFVVESGSMMRPDAPWGRIGTIDPGDLVVIEKYREGMEIETFYGGGDREVAGGRGDVIMYLPVEYRPDQEIFPIIHRAVAYIQRDTVTVSSTDPRTGETQLSQTPRFTVEEFGIVNARAVNIPELGLHNYQPSIGGYLTRGDNPRSNNWADQALGVTPFPVPEDRIVGRIKAEVPVIGLAKIALTGQDQRMLSMDDEWCSFLAGHAACDTWVLFFIVTGVFVGVPLVITVALFGRRLWTRQLDRLALRRQDADATASARRAKDDEDRPPAVPVHDATDLLTGKVRIGPHAVDPGPRWTPPARGSIRTDGD